jgi:DNA modification methylase
LKTFVCLKNEQQRTLPAEFRNDDVRYTDALVEHFINEFTAPGDVVFDPFCGFGTTMLVAERCGRDSYGIEYELKRCEYVRSLVKHPERVIHGDSTKLSQIEVPPFDLCITSPPYMGKDHTEDPLKAYSTTGTGYGDYLKTLQSIFAEVAAKLNPSGRAVIEVSNLKHEDGSITTLAWDIAHSLSEVMRFMGEVVVLWEPTYNYGYDHSYCLVFKKL